MTIEIKVPVLPESVADATIITWHKKAGDAVKRDEILVDLETDKVVLEVPAPTAGILEKIEKPVGSVVKSQEILGIVNESAATQTPVANTTPETKQATKSAAVTETPALTTPIATPSARRAASENDIDLQKIEGSGKGGRIIKEDVLKPSTSTSIAPTTISFDSAPGARLEKRVPLSRLRARIAERLLQVKNNTALLTTFNEINMQSVIHARTEYKESFEKKHGVKLGFMSFFTHAVVEALKSFPIINASLEDNDIVYHGYYDIGMAVSTERGLVVPILRDVDKMTYADIEKKVLEYSQKARTGQLAIEEITGGTFTITNGGVFGSLLSTPIINPPQSAILGL